MAATARRGRSWSAARRGAPLGGALAGAQRDEGGRAPRQDIAHGEDGVGAGRSGDHTEQCDAGTGQAVDGQHGAEAGQADREQRPAPARDLGWRDAGAQLAPVVRRGGCRLTFDGSPPTHPFW